MFKKLLEIFNVYTKKLTLIPQKELFEMQCCRCPKPAFEQWMQGVCADTKTRGKFMPLCVECDIELNKHHLRFFFGDSREEDLALYEIVKLQQAKDAGKILTSEGEKL